MSQHTQMLLLLVCLSSATTAFANKPDLDQCLALRDNIKKYTELRRQGGSAEDMEKWKRERSAHEQTFRDLRCRKLGKAVR